MSVVLDASVITKLLVEEPGSAAVRELVATTPTLIAPELVLAEVGNALWRRVRLGGMQADAAAELFRAVPAIVTVLHALAPLSPRALAISLARNHPIYDCYYIALALREAVPLATADRRLAKLAAAEGVSVLPIPEDHPSGPSSA